MEFSKAVELPLYVWLIVPAVIIFVVSLLHMIYYGMKNYFAGRSLVKDRKSLLTLARARVIQENADVVIVDKELAEVAKILKASELNVVQTTQDDERTSASDFVIAIKNGEYVSPKDLRLTVENPLYRQNTINRVNTDEDFALDTLNRKEDAELTRLAFFKVLETKSMTTVKKAIEGLDLDKDMVKALLAKDAQTEEQFRIDPLEVDNYIRNYGFDAKDFVEVVKNYKELGLNQSFIAMFENLTAQNEEATEAYLYVLFEFEMIDKIREILDNAEKTDFIAYRALLDLKDSGKNYTLDSIAYCTTC
jgi:hypothetical protein